MSTNTYMGQCFCGAVQFSVVGTPEGMGYCHCESCRAWSASPVNAFTLWPPGAVKITQGTEHIGEFRKTPQSHRRFCTQCGGHLMTFHPEMELVDVYSAMLPDLEFKPELHVHYGKKVLAIRDDLPKYVDMPAAHGGSGKELMD